MGEQAHPSRSARLTPAPARRWVSALRHAATWGSRSLSSWAGTRMGGQKGRKCHCRPGSGRPLGGDGPGAGLSVRDWGCVLQAEGCGATAGGRPGSSVGQRREPLWPAVKSHVGGGGGGPDPTGPPGPCRQGGFRPAGHRTPSARWGPGSDGAWLTGLRAQSPSCVENGAQKAIGGQGGEARVPLLFELRSRLVLCGVIPSDSH